MIHQTKHSFALKFLSCLTAFFFAFSTILFSIPVQAQSINNLPLPGSMIALSKSFAPVNVKGMTINLQNPFEFDFIVHPGDTGLEGEAFKDEAYKLVKYFLETMSPAAGS